MSFLNEEQKSAAAERVGAAVDEPTGAKPVEGSPASEKPVQENLAPEVVDNGVETPANAEETFTLTLEGDRQVEVDSVEAHRLMQLGMKAGDEGTIKTVRDLEKFVSENPAGARALKALVDDPEAAARFVEGLPKGEKEGEGEDPRDKQIRELQSEVQGLRGAPEGSKTPEQIVSEAASHYPALKGLPVGLLTSAVEGRMNKGQSLSSALAGFASEQNASSKEHGDNLRGETTVTNRLRGVGGGGSAPSAVPEAAKRDGSSLGNGGALGAARRRLAGG